MVRLLTRAVSLGAMLLVLTFSAHAAAPGPILGESIPSHGRRFDVVFVFDSTGSMERPLIGVKSEILGIMKMLTSDESAPIVRFGIVSYRDRHSEYVVKHLPLTEDHELARKFLGKISAGGGDGPIAHVDLAMHIAVSRMNWDWDKNTARVIFLFGDTPPHGLDSAFSYKREAGIAHDRGITVNAIACMNYPKMVEAWKEMATVTGGEFRYMVFIAKVIGRDGAAHYLITDGDESFWISDDSISLESLRSRLYFLAGTGKLRPATTGDLPPDIPDDYAGRVAYIVARAGSGLE